MDTQGERIKKVRKHFRLSQQDFGDSIGVTQAAVSSMENGNGVALETLSKISDTYKINRDWLIDSTGPMLSDSKPEVKNEAIQHLSYSKLFLMWEESEKSRQNLINVVRLLAEQNHTMANTIATLSSQKVKS